MASRIVHWLLFSFIQEAVDQVHINQARLINEGSQSLPIDQSDLEI